MRILTDHCVFGKTVKLLRQDGHEVITLQELNKNDVEDEEVLELAFTLNAILVTNDKEFGNIMKYLPQQYKGIIVLKITLKNQVKSHEILLNMLRKYGHAQLDKRMVVIDNKTYRIRR